MLVRRLAVATALLLVPVAAGCGSGGGKPSTAEVAAAIQEDDPSINDEQATCMADVLRDILPADTLRGLMDDDADEGQFDDAAFDELSEAEGFRLMGAIFECVDFDDFGTGDELDFDMEDFDVDGEVDGGDPGQNPFGN